MISHYSATPRSGDKNDDDEEDDDGGDGNNNNIIIKKKNGRKKTSPSGLMTDGEEAARLPKWMETEKADVCYPAFRSTTASSCKDSLDDAENPKMFVQTLDSNIITFERVIDTKLSDIFRYFSMHYLHRATTLCENGRARPRLPLSTFEPPKKKQNPGKQFNKKDTQYHDHRERDHKHDGGRRYQDRRSPPRGEVSHASGQWASEHIGAHDGD
ncbi:hypothetical protein PR001_g12554 [Phytophthora rubi]|uniref:Uncharacterized protein n=1 Tax=Phytophthora rubi TaxID=129364 RepID=A0A6A3M9K8_9STRA|nr:hypothetical protein PR001_g12554 [Phytophthora rubi]